jgi:hypothetical protein
LNTVGKSFAWVRLFPTNKTETPAAVVAAFAESDRKTANATLQFRDIGSNPRKTRAA